MKTVLYMLIISVLQFSATGLYCQEKCKVLKTKIAGTYEGKCKNGFAHGKGIATGVDRYEGFFNKGMPHGKGVYTWATGDSYDGEWTEGMRNGIGRFTMKLDGRDSIQDGLWQKDVFMGPKPQNPYVIYKTGVDRFTFKKNNTTKNRILIDIYKNGARNNNISNFLISTTSGTDTKVGLLIGYDFITFPVTIKLLYVTLNKFNTYPSQVQFEFEIYEPGDWTVELVN